MPTARASVGSGQKRVNLLIDFVNSDDFNFDS